MKIFFGLILGVATFMGFSSYTQTYAQLLETAAAGITIGAIGDRVGKDLIKEAREKASSLLAEGRNSGNAVLVRAADEINASADEITRVLSDRIDKKVENLREDEQRLLLGLAQATKAADSLANKMLVAKETLTLDIQSILGNLPLTTEVFSLRKVSGLTVLKKDNDYVLQIIGSYVGLPTSGYSTSLTLSIQGKPIQQLRVDPLQAHVANIVIPAASLNEYFKEFDVAIVDADLKIEYSHPGHIALIIPHEKTDEVISHMHLALYPVYAGEVELLGKQVVYGWKSISPDVKEQLGPNAHCESHCNGWYGIPWDFDIVVSGGEKSLQAPGDIRITQADCRPIPGYNGFDEDIRGSVTDHGTRGTCHVRAGSHPSNYRLTVQREQWAPVGDKELKISLPLSYETLSEVHVPSDISAIRIRGRTLWGDQFDALDSEPDPNLPVQIVKRVQNANDASLFLRVARPRESE